ncbi:UDP-N-acetylenolpyruvoylglucosamine reductase [Slackia heliotrinireducens]|uniref:UDP-N-acetylenolpyruvoylglucosamine reductase n=1 Tax=Slackia heliotrinireducens (strain ATCC 29202 / DSM 20476 / NCTC 11029 / RHS 1) TaxID=471855 RepID=C7N4U9_SLAHD|nr:UDP-N-acetylmuramate dehydrogenase [Slackia heliotrinireducens]ACV21934.1 UDP-N-acetylenolpyruvoylglucosamine reductase [Slackia heliotrinireducens DSM 20476]VEG99766.1 UDP-N-acetylenolpyruvoylglucosamine reductase [Slackia heliotrinireducens]
MTRNAIRLMGEDFEGEVLENEPLSRHTTYRIGGPARLYARVESLHALIAFSEYCVEQGIPWFVLGRGSNLLVSDAGFPGAVIVLGQGFSSCSYDDAAHVFTAGASCPLSRVVHMAYERGRAGMEFAVGTPGSVGGALRMNAGSRHEYIGSRVLSVTSYRPGEGLVRHRAADIEWGYRESTLPNDEIMLECELSSFDGDPEMIRARMDNAMSLRRKTQPLAAPSCGSVFKNPKGDSVGRLIENVGLKGARCGGAQISDLHANFIVNCGDARADDVLTLMHRVQDAVAEAYGIELEPEVRFLGFA